MAEKKPDDAPEGFKTDALISSAESGESDPWLKEQRLEELINELESIRDDYEFTDLEESLLRAAKYDIGLVIADE